MNQTRTNYQQFINDIYTSQKHVLSLVTKLSQRIDDLEARLRSIKDDQNLHLSAVKNSLDQLRGEIHHQYTQESTEIDELNDVLAGELENLSVIPRANRDNINFADDSLDDSLEWHPSNDRKNTTSHNHTLYNGQLTNLDELVDNEDKIHIQPAAAALIL